MQAAFLDILDSPTPADVEVGVLVKAGTTNYINAPILILAEKKIRLG